MGDTLKYLLALLFVSFSACAQDSSAYGGSMLGLSFGLDQMVCVDLYGGARSVGATTYGFHAGYYGKTGNDVDKDVPRVAGTYDRTRNWTGFQLGFYYNMGRGFYAVGAEHLQTEIQTVHVANNFDMQSDPAVKSSKAGVYGKVGYSVKRMTIYGSYGSCSKAMLGVGFYF